MRVVSMNEVCVAASLGPFGSNLTADQYSSEGIPVLRGKNIREDGVLDLGELVYVPRSMAERFTNSIARSGDIVTPHRGAIGRVAVIPEGKEFLVSSSMIRAKLDGSRVDSRYVARYFTTRHGRNEILMYASTVGTPGIGEPLKSFRQFRFPLRPLVEQQAIAEVLGALDDKIAANSRLSLLVEERLRALFERDIRRGEPRFLSEFLLLNPRRKPPSDPAPQIPMQMLPSPGVAIPEFGVASPNGGVRFMNGDTLLARITPSLENGKTGYVLCLRDGEVGFGSTEYIVMRSRSGYPLPLSYFVATDPGFRAEAIQRMVGSSGRQRVKADDLADLTFPLTKDGRALERFESCAGPELQLTQTLAVESRTLARLRDALLPPLMDGTLRVKDAVAHVEEVL